MGSELESSEASKTVRFVDDRMDRVVIPTLFVDLLMPVAPDARRSPRKSESSRLCWWRRRGVGRFGSEGVCGVKGLYADLVHSDPDAALQRELLYKGEEVGRGIL